MKKQFLRGIFKRLRGPSEQGFILPVVIVLALAISTVSVSVLQTVSNSSNTLNDQYYKALATEAAQAGLTAAAACVKTDINNIWTELNQLKPKTNCLGVANTTGLDYVSKNENWESTYSVKAPLKTANDLTIISVGTVNIKSPAGATIRSFTQSLKSVATVGGRASKAVTDLSVGWAHVCTAAEGRAYCWGWNANGQLGNGLTTNTGTPVEVSQATTATPAQPSIPNPCGGFAQPACTKIATPAIPISAMANKNVTAIAAGTNHTCAIAEGIVYCWGKNDLGQLGNNSTVNSNVPVSVYMSPIDVPAQPALPSGCGSFWTPCTTPAKPAVSKGVLVDKTPVSISAGEDYTCVVAYPTSSTISNSRAYCWGKNNDGQLGVNDKTNRLVPTAVYSGDATAATPAQPAGCGSLFSPCTTPAQPAQPASPLFNKTVTSITTGTAHTCAITSEGVGSCWGLDSSGQVGSGQTPNTSGGVEPQVTCTDRNAGTIGTEPNDIPDVVVPKLIHTRDAYTFTDFFGNTQNVAASALFNKKLLFINATGPYTNALADDGRVYWWGGKSPRSSHRTKNMYKSCTERKYSSPPCASNQDSCNVTKFELHDVSWTEYVFYITDEPVGPIYKDQYKCWWIFTCYDNNLLTNKQLKMFSGNANLGTFCALDLTSSVYCDGTAYPYYGQRGDGRPLSSAADYWGSLFEKSIPTQVDQTGVLAGKTINKMEAGANGNFTCVVANQAVYCWGVNDVGEMGDGTIGISNSKLRPTAVDISGPLGKPGGANLSNPIIY